MRPTSPVIAVASFALALCVSAEFHRASAQAPDPASFLAGQTKDCPGCNLAGVSLKRRNLAGANLAGAKLAGASFHRAVLRGANLSGGQRQRVAIARALATNPRILILDEATSALDYESERIIQQNMRRIVKDRTVIVIAHRLAAVRGCDRIVGMADGRIVEVGEHEELIRRAGGLYAHLWGLQTQSVEAVS